MPESTTKTRAVRRMIDRINRKAAETFQVLTENYYACFLDMDPNGFDVKEKQKELSAKWRMYCKRGGLISEAYPKFDEYCESINKQYHQELDANKLPERTLEITS